METVNEYGEPVHQGGRPPYGQPQYPVPPQQHMDNYGQQQYPNEHGTLPRDGTLPRGDHRGGPGGPDYRDPYSHTNTLDRSPRHHHGGPPQSPHRDNNHHMGQPQYPVPPPHLMQQQQQQTYVNQPNDYRGPPRDQKDYRDYRDTSEYGRRRGDSASEQMPPNPDGSLYRPSRGPAGPQDNGGFPPPPPHHMGGPHSPHSPGSGQFPPPPFNHGAPGQQPPHNQHNGGQQQWGADPNASLPRQMRHGGDPNMPPSPAQQFDRVSIIGILVLIIEIDV